MNTLKRAMWEMARSKGLEKSNDETRYNNTPNSQLPDGLIKIDDNIYKYPENPTTEDLLSMLIYTTAKAEQHLRFIKKLFYCWYHNCHYICIIRINIIIHI